MKDGEWLDQHRGDDWIEGFFNKEVNLKMEISRTSCFTEQGDSARTFAICRRFELLSPGTIYMCVFSRVNQNDKDTVEILVTRSEFNTGEVVRGDEWNKKIPVIGLYPCLFESKEPGVTDLVKKMHELGAINRNQEKPSYLNFVVEQMQNQSKRKKILGIF